MTRRYIEYINFFKNKILTTNLIWITNCENFFPCVTFAVKLSIILVAVIASVEIEVNPRFIRTDFEHRRQA